jgi:hypothetical protein
MSLLEKLLLSGAMGLFWGCVFPFIVALVIDRLACACRSYLARWGGIQASGPVIVNKRITEPQQFWDS